MSFFIFAFSSNFVDNENDKNLKFLLKISIQRNGKIVNTFKGIF